MDFRKSILREFLVYTFFTLQHVVLSNFKPTAHKCFFPSVTALCCLLLSIQMPKELFEFKTVRLQNCLNLKARNIWYYVLTTSFGCVFPHIYSGTVFNA